MPREPDKALRGGAGLGGGEGFQQEGRTGLPCLVVAVDGVPRIQIRSCIGKKKPTPQKRILLPTKGSTCRVRALAGLQACSVLPTEPGVATGLSPTSQAERTCP